MKSLKTLLVAAAAASSLLALVAFAGDAKCDKSDCPEKDKCCCCDGAKEKAPEKK